MAKLRKNWRNIIGLIALAALAYTLFAMMVYPGRTVPMQIAGGVAIVLGATFFLTGGLNQLRFFRSRQFLRGSASTVYTLAVIGILILVNVVAGHTSVRWDVTEAGLFTLSDQTISTLRNLDQDVEIRAFFPRESAIRSEVKTLLNEYSHHSNRVRVQFIDPEEKPAIARQYEITQPFTTVIETNGKKQHISGYSLYDFSGFQEQAPDPTQIKFRGEQSFTRAIIRLTQDIETKVYFVQGHGETSLHESYSQLANFLIGEGLQVDELDIARQGEIPDDASIVVVGGPSRDLSTQATELLRDYVDDGGKVMLLLRGLEDQEREFPNLESLVNHLGLYMRRDAVVDPDRAFFQDPLSPVPRISFHAITEGLIEQGLAVALPFSRSLDALEDYEGPMETQRILVSSSDAWSETNPSSPNRQNAEVTGALSLGYAVSQEVPDDEGEGTTKESVAVVIGSSAFVENDLFGFQGNADLFLNATQWMMDREELISIRPQEPEMRRLFLTPTDGRMIFYSLTVALPFLIIVAGATVWLRRRNK